MYAPHSNVSSWPLPTLAAPAPAPVTLTVSDHDASAFNRPAASPPETQMFKLAVTGKSTNGPSRKPHKSASIFRLPEIVRPPGTTLADELTGASPMEKPGPS